MLELALLRLPEKAWRESFAPATVFEVDEEGFLLTGDPVLDRWEREAARGLEAHQPD
jgi:hypothetical protein